MIIAVDFDQTISDKRLQMLIKKFVSERNEVWVVTMRRDNEFNRKYLRPTLEKTNISEFNVIYCNDKPKLEMLQMINADIYIDNQNTEFENIFNHSNVIPLLF